MRVLMARVRNGRLVLDEPTDRPDGEAVELVQLAEVAGWSEDPVDDADRAALAQELEASLDEVDAGRTEDFSKLLAELRQRMK